MLPLEREACLNINQTENIRSHNENMLMVAKGARSRVHWMTRSGYKVNVEKPANLSCFNAVLF